MDRLRWLGCFAFAMLLPGCGPSGPQTYLVSGTVALDGKPVPDGDVILNADDQLVSADAGKIQDGKFTFRAKPGKKQVVIQASRLVSRGKGAVGEPIYEDYIPAKYNTATTLTVEVTPEGPNTWDFDLESKK